MLLLDEIAIKKETVWNEKKKQCAGTCDYGSIKAEEPDSAAQNKMSSDVLTKVVINGINLLTEAGMEVYTITCDGCSKNLASANKLGCGLTRFDSSFPRLSRPNQKIYIYIYI